MTSTVTRVLHEAFRKFPYKNVNKKCNVFNANQIRHIKWTLTKDVRIEQLKSATETEPDKF